MKHCPECNSSGHSLKIIDYKNVCMCVNCNYVYWKHNLDCKCEKCYCGMCFLQFMESLVPTFANADKCPDCGNQWTKNNCNFFKVCHKKF